MAEALSIVADRTERGPRPEAADISRVDAGAAARRVLCVCPRYEPSLGSFEYAYDITGSLRAFLKDKIKEIQRDKPSLMPSYGTALGKKEIEDLIAYLSSLRGTQP